MSQRNQDDLRPRGADPSVDWDARQAGVVRRALNRFERMSLAFERLPASRDRRFNPMYHTGTLAVFFLGILVVTGLYLFLFYEFGFDSTYQAVGRIESNLIGRLMRAIHRYASAATVIVSLLHAWRTFFQDRFRGARWLAWVSGVVIMALLWVAGVSGYWLIWDARAGVLNQTFIDFVGAIPGGDAFLLRYLTGESAGSGWMFLVLVLTAHVLVTVVLGLFFWYHIKRLQRPKLLPPSYWMWLSTLILLLAAVVAPVGMLAPLDETLRPDRIDIDGWFLFYLPITLRNPWVWWIAGGLLTALFAAIPWLLRRRIPLPVVIDVDRCTGCTLCYVDCPYRAMSMERIDGNLLAVLDPSLCVSCGICIGSCPPLAISFDSEPPERAWLVGLEGLTPGQNVQFACERHGVHGSFASDSLIVAVPCIGAIHPDQITFTFDAGAGSVDVVGCPPDDCANREGNQLTQARLDRSRRPRLDEALADAPIATHWLPPDENDAANSTPSPSFNPALELTQWRRLIPAGAVIAVVAVVQVLLTYLPFEPYPDDAAVIEVAMEHRPGQPLEGDVPRDPVPVDGSSRLELRVDGVVLMEEEWTASQIRFFEQLEVPAGVHDVSLRLLEADNPPIEAFSDQRDLESNEVLRIEVVDSSSGPDPDRGEGLFDGGGLRGNFGCAICHSLRPGDDGVGPSLAGIATEAESRVPGMTSKDYLVESILAPDAFIVEGFPAGQMLPNFADVLSEDELNDLVAFLLTLR